MCSSPLSVHTSWYCFAACRCLSNIQPLASLWSFAERFCTSACRSEESSVFVKNNSISCPVLLIRLSRIWLHSCTRSALLFFCSTVIVTGCIGKSSGAMISWSQLWSSPPSWTRITPSSPLSFPAASLSGVTSFSVHMSCFSTCR